MTVKLSRDHLTTSNPNPLIKKFAKKTTILAALLEHSKMAGEARQNILLFCLTPPQESSQPTPSLTFLTFSHTVPHQLRTIRRRWKSFCPFLQLNSFMDCTEKGGWKNVFNINANPAVIISNSLHFFSQQLHFPPSAQPPRKTVMKMILVI